MIINKNEDLLSKLNLKEVKLNALLEITNAINSNDEIEKLLKLYTFILQEQLGFKKIILLLKSDQWQCLIKVNFKGKIEVDNTISDLLKFKDITIVESSKSDILTEFQTVIPVLRDESALAFLLLSTNVSNTQLEPSYFSFTQILTNIITVAIENKRLSKQSLIKERISKDLEVASEMQKLLFPSDLPSNRMMDVSAKYISRHAIGGDYYDFIPLGDEEYIICIADVSGKGISAALLMANFQATIRTLFKYQRFEMAFLIEELNKKIIHRTNGEKFITFFIAHYNAHTRKMKYVNAGHNHHILLNRKSTIMLGEGCIGLGMLDEIPSIKVGEIVLEPNTTFVLYTDGIVELENSTGESFGIERLIDNIRSYSKLAMEDMNNIILSKLDEWRENLNYADDTAILSCKFF